MNSIFSALRPLSFHRLPAATHCSLELSHSTLQLSSATAAVRQLVVQTLLARQVPPSTLSPAAAVAAPPPSTRPRRYAMPSHTGAGDASLRS